MFQRPCHILQLSGRNLQRKRFISCPNFLSTLSAKETKQYVIHVFPKAYQRSVVDTALTIVVRLGVVRPKKVLPLRIISCLLGNS